MVAPPSPSPASAPCPQAILFDLDGTLLDSIELILRSARYAFEKLKRTPPSDDEWRANVGIPLFTTFRRYADESEIPTFIAAYREYQLANHDRLTRCYDGAASTISELRRRGHDIAVVTSKSEALAMRGLALVGLARHMDTVVGCDASTRHKPDPEPVRIALRRLDCAPENAIFVGDSVHDVMAGNAAGVRTIAATWGAGRREELEPANPALVLNQIAELTSWLSANS
ncbi:MAG TPA: HAD-IA family hydrolase [Gemmatimonadaceae bacterium]|jgi:pyrophosphatase PpaX|nr:HAD-IA family hydrolase [Gemmatimonadaceae bacterium]